MDRSRILAILLTAIGCVTVMATALLSSATVGSQSVLVLGSLLPAAGLFLSFQSPTGATVTEADNTTGSKANLATDREEFEEWRSQTAAALEAQSLQVEQRRQALNDRLLQYREFLEYPHVDRATDTSTSAILLSEQDREVNRLLEQEAARVYEKIRADGYKTDGRLDAAIIRGEVFDIIQQVARVYAPDSNNPLLETSFDQLARAASRVCLQALVLVEQLPIDVQHYTIAQLYSYIRKAVDAWGTWQSVSPWLTRVSRGMYAGRLAAGSSPVTMGAWWLASELGRHGTKKLVDKYVDQRAVTFLNDAVRLVGNEVACVYGPGIRQRDPAWAHGAELAEINHRFPRSRDSMQACLRQITVLPLRSEYDRVYLYRCIAEHKPSGFRLDDPTILTRDEREAIAAQLEEFFQQHVHGADDEATLPWKDSVEERFDLRLSLSNDRPDTARISDPRAALLSVHSFLTQAGGLSVEQAVETIRHSDLFLQQSTVEQRALTAELIAMPHDGFAPPDLDPADSLTSAYLTELVACVAHGRLYDESLDTLLLETGRYFRRGEEDMRRLIADGWEHQLRQRTHTDAPVSSRHQIPARQILAQLRAGEMLTGVYTGVTIEPTPQAATGEPWLIAIQHEGQRRLVLFNVEGDTHRIWEADEDFTAERVGGFIIDDCAITGGRWSLPYTAERILLSGKFGTGFATWFGPLVRSPADNT